MLPLDGFICAFSGLIQKPQHPKRQLGTDGGFDVVCKDIRIRQICDLVEAVLHLIQCLVHCLVRDVPAVGFVVNGEQGDYLVFHASLNNSSTGRVLILPLFTPAALRAISFA